jgi:hypothetical protein
MKNKAMFETTNQMGFHDPSSGDLSSWDLWDISNSDLYQIHFAGL